MSSLMNVLLTAWIRSSGWAVLAASTIGSTGSSSAWTRSSSPGDAGDDPNRRSVGGHQPGLGWDLERVRDLIERRVSRCRRCRPAEARRSATRSPTAVLERRVLGGARIARDDHEELLVGIVGPAGVEDVVRLAGLELPVVRVGVDFAGIDATGGRAARNRPMVAANHRTTTGQRWRALHIATRTVAGSRPGAPG